MLSPELQGDFGARCAVRSVVGKKNACWLHGEEARPFDFGMAACIALLRQWLFIQISTLGLGLGFWHGVQDCRLRILCLSACDDAHTSTENGTA